jgi:hypothetical protein
MQLLGWHTHIRTKLVTSLICFCFGKPQHNAFSLTELWLILAPIQFQHFSSDTNSRQRRSPKESWLCWCQNKNKPMQLFSHLRFTRRTYLPAKSNKCDMIVSLLLMVCPTLLFRKFKLKIGWHYLPYSHIQPATKPLKSVFCGNISSWGWEVFS